MNKHHVYAEKAAMTIEITHHPKIENGQTLNFEFARKIAGRYDWSSKVIFQLNPYTELPLFCAFAFNFAPTFAIRRPDHKLDAKAQQGGHFIYVDTTTHGEYFALPVPLGDITYIAALGFRSLKANTQLSDSALLTSLKSLLKLY